MKLAIFLILLVMPAAAVLAQPFVCSDFNGGTAQGWWAEAAWIELSQPGPDGTLYLRCHDGPSPPYSGIYAPPEYLGDWSGAGLFCFDIILHEDGWPDESHPLSPVLHLKSTPVEETGLRAVLWITEPISDEDGPNSGWHSITVPVHPVNSLPLPSSDTAYWEIPQPVQDPVSDWNALLQDIQVFRFIADIAGSPTQLEDFGLDNICVGLCDVTAASTATWGTIKALYQ